MSSHRANPKAPPNSVAIGIDVGGTKIAAGLVGLPEFEVLREEIIPTPSTADGPALLDQVEEIVLRLAAEARQRRTTLEALGFGVCEIVDREGKIRSANAVPWIGLPLQERFRRLGPVTVEADVRAAALAEATLGAGRDCSVFLYVTIGTGISCCLVQDGRPYLGARGATGTLASSPLPVEFDRFSPHPPPSFEDLGSGPALVRRFRDQGGDAQRAEEVLTAASAGDLRAISVLRQGAQALGTAIGWAVNVLDPEAIVLGGGLGLADGLYRDALVAAVRRQIWWEGHRDLPILSATTGPRAGLIGAAIAALNLTRPHPHGIRPTTLPH